MVKIESIGDLDGAPHANVFPDAEPKTIRLTLDAGEAVAAHDHPDREIVLYLIEGAIELTLDDEEYDLNAGDIVRFDGRREVSPRAIEPSVALIVLAERSSD
ncbi:MULTISPECIES: cupin domain-containing protein [Halobacteriales]|uniref:Cupin domain-containing protein n=2 Tax=Halobacteriales TaxID=2235 RepID=A0ABD5UPF7_9EURY|nr:cupin domain-containing protein [Halomarina sp. PSRA2]